jgi:hypothetical protein
MSPQQLNRMTAVVYNLNLVMEEMMEPINQSLGTSKLRLDANFNIVCYGSVHLDLLS